MTGLSTTGSHRPANTTHAGLLDEARGSADTARVVDDVVQAVRTGGAPPAG